MKIKDKYLVFSTPFGKIATSEINNPCGKKIVGTFLLAWGDNSVEDLTTTQQLKSVVSSVFSFPVINDFGEAILDNAALFCSHLKPRQLFFRNTDYISSYIQRYCFSGR